MSNVSRTLRQTLTIARRDFVSTVFTPTFLVFLLAPMIMIGFSVIGSLGAQSVASRGEASIRAIVIAPAEDHEGLLAADRALRSLWDKDDEDAPASLRIDMPTDDPAAQARALFDNSSVEASAVLYGPLDHPRILWAGRGRDDAAYLAMIAEQVLRARASGGTAPLSTPVVESIQRERVTTSDKSRVALLGVFGLFFITLMLSSQTVGTMAEEKSNKVIEVLAAAVPLESVFLGKMLGMLGVAVLFLLFWGTVVANLNLVMPVSIVTAMANMGPAVGYPAYPLLFVAYFTMAFLLLGGAFLAIGAQAATPREIQMLSLPITIFQVGMLGFASVGAGSPGSWVATAAEVFPFSSPFAMIAQAANSAALWPHFLALGWQALWVAVVVTLGARWFSRGVLQSGSPKLWRRRKAPAAQSY